MNETPRDITLSPIALESSHEVFLPRLDPFARQLRGLTPPRNAPLSNTRNSPMRTFLTALLRALAAAAA
jgi:hypothetical protein